MSLNQSSGRRSFSRGLKDIWQNSGMVLVFVLMFVAAMISVENFASWGNMLSLGLAVATIGMIACTMMFCLASGDFDLSVGSNVAFTGVLAARIITTTHNVALGIVVGVIAGTIVGLVNGTVIAWIGINALITTLATMQIVRGAAFLAAPRGEAIGVPEKGFFPLGNSTLGDLIHINGDNFGTPFQQILSIPMPVLIMIACFVVFGILLNKTTFGRNTLAIGGNKEASRLAGIPVVRTKILIFALQGLVAGFAGVVLASRMTSGQPNTSTGLELQVISACVLGGVSLTGGVAAISGVVVGVFIMGTVQNVMNLWRVPTFWQMVASGGILLAAVLLDRLKQRRA